MPTLIRSPKEHVLYKQDLQNKLNAAVQTSPSDGGSDFYYTTLIPGNFAASPGWTRFSFYEGDYETHYSKETSRWGGGCRPEAGTLLHWRTRQWVKSRGKPGCKI
jgi:hypothetical protein